MLGCGALRGTPSGNENGSKPNKEVSIGNLNSRHLVYDCDNFQSQAKSAEDVTLLRIKAIETLRETYAQRNLVLASSISSAEQSADYVRLEELLVRYECQNLSAK